MHAMQPRLDVASLTETFARNIASNVVPCVWVLVFHNITNTLETRSGMEAREFLRTEVRMKAVRWEWRPWSTAWISWVDCGTAVREEIVEGYSWMQRYRQWSLAAKRNRNINTRKSTTRFTLLIHFSPCILNFQCLGNQNQAVKWTCHSDHMPKKRS